ncbi:MAG: threonylcarbamoyl-AMP synthase, partial [Holosporales bacterium]|nr:threonylcarbamoyl-AMP synthase [Holosporales bacterium]
MTWILPGASEEAQALARERLLHGKLVSFPTETVYGLGALATHRGAVEEVYRLKNRPLSKPLILHGATAKDLFPYAERGGGLRAVVLARIFWPGPLTLVLKRCSHTTLEESLFFPDETIALRVVDHPVATALLNSVGGPLVAPSANLSGELSPTTAADVASAFLNEDLLILDGGPTRHGLESTILDITGPQASLCRLGAISQEALEGCLGEKLALSLSSTKGRSLTLKLNAIAPRAEEAFLAFGAKVPACPCVAQANLSPSGDLEEAGRNLFPLLRQLWASSASAIAVMPIPSQGLGLVLNDRL